MTDNDKQIKVFKHQLMINYMDAARTDDVETLKQLDKLAEGMELEFLPVSLQGRNSPLGIACKHRSVNAFKYFLDNFDVEDVKFAIGNTDSILIYNMAVEKHPELKEINITFNIIKGCMDCDNIDEYLKTIGLNDIHDKLPSGEYIIRYVLKYNGLFDSQTYYMGLRNIVKYKSVKDYLYDNLIDMLSVISYKTVPYLIEYGVDLHLNTCKYILCTCNESHVLNVVKNYMEQKYTKLVVKSQFSTKIEPAVKITNDEYALKEINNYMLNIFKPGDFITKPKFEKRQFKYFKEYVQFLLNSYKEKLTSVDRYLDWIFNETFMIAYPFNDNVRSGEQYPHEYAEMASLFDIFVKQKYDLYHLGLDDETIECIISDTFRVWTNLGTKEQPKFGNIFSLKKMQSSVRYIENVLLAESEDFELTDNDHAYIVKQVNNKAK
jgi:hypothetical protein